MFIMKTLYAITSSVLLFTGTAVAQPVPFDLKNQFIIQFESSISNEKRHAIALEITNAKGQVHHHYSHALQGMSITLPPQALTKLQERFGDAIIHIEKNQIVSLAKPGNGKGGGGKGDGDSGSTTPRAPEVIPWGVSRVGGPQIAEYGTAWVIDTGIDSRHPDLNVDKNRGANFIRGKNTTEDGNGHGTHIAGTIAAKVDGYDVVGVAAGATVIPVRVLDNNGSGTMDGVIAGVDHVYRNGQYGDCANMSLGAQGFSSALDTAIKAAANKGIIFAVAAGNSSANAANFTPASTTHPNVFTISSVGQYDNFSWFSNYGSVVEYALPGENILSTKTGGGTVAYNGTSMAAPHFCGLAIIGSYYINAYANNDPDGSPDPIPSL
ncbi:S8 family serine peptidase [Photobacterium damselae]|uniref:S8 family serine peptidase n=1 Tax=Photobacterium damselae TaxID=38293 RepID=UPI0040689A86